jgi:hypothetical protein
MFYLSYLVISGQDYKLPFSNKQTFIMMNNTMNNKTITSESSPSPLKGLNGVAGIFPKPIETIISESSPSPLKGLDGIVGNFLQSIKTQAGASSVTPAGSIDLKQAENNPIGYLQELTVANSWRMPKYSLISQSGPDHIKTFTIECEIETITKQGIGATKKIAKRMSAYEVLKCMNLRNRIYNPQVLTAVKSIMELVNKSEINDDKMIAQSGKKIIEEFDSSKFNYAAYHPKQRKDLILKELYSDYCIYFYQGDYGNCISIINQSKRNMNMKHKKRNQKRNKHREDKFHCEVLSSMCAPFQAGNKINELAKQIEEEDVVGRVGEAVDSVSSLSSSTQSTFRKIDKVLDDFNSSDLLSKASVLTDNIELLCKTTTSAVEKADGIFDQVMKFLEPSGTMAQKAIIITAATKLFASCEYSIANLFAYFTCICATFDITSTFFSTTYAHFKSIFEQKFSCQATNEDEDGELLTLLASITHTLAAIVNVPITTNDIIKKLSDFGRAATGSEKIYKIFNSIFSWVRNKYFRYTYDISYDQYKMQVKFPELTKLAECCLLIGQADNEEIDSTKSLCEVILETDKLAHEMSMCTLKESDASRYITTLRASIKPAVTRAMRAPVMNKPSRRKPFAIYLYGKAGTGKTNLTDIIRATLYKKYYAGVHEQGWEHSSFSRKTENEYWEGYYNQPMCVYDDIFQLHDSRDKPNAEMMEIIRVINDDDCQLHMATLEDKAGKFFTSDFVICTSNVRIPACQSIACPAAVYRRFDVCVDVEVDPLYGKRLSDREGTYLGIDDTKVSQVVDTNVYALSTYNMNSPNGGQRITHTKTNDENSFDVFINYLCDKIDAHRAGNIDRQSHLKILAGEIPLSKANAGLARASKIAKTQNSIPSSRAIKSMHGKAPFVPTIGDDDMQAESYVTYSPTDEIVELVLEQENPTWRQKLYSLRKRAENVLSNLCDVSNIKEKIPSIFDFPTQKFSSRFSQIKQKISAFITKIKTQINLREMVDSVFENISSIMLGVTSIIGVVMTGVYIRGKKQDINVSCPLYDIKMIEELVTPTSCMCENCKLLRPYISRVDMLDDKCKIASHLYDTLNILSKDEDLLKYLTTLMEAEKVLSNMRDNNLNRKIKLLQESQKLTTRDETILNKIHTVDACQTRCEISSGDNVTRKNVSSMITEISSGDNITRKNISPMITEISSGDNVTKNKSTTMVTEISSGDPSTRGKSKNVLISEDMTSKVKELVKVANDETIMLMDSDYDILEEGDGNITNDATGSLMTCQGMVNKDQCFQEQYNKCISRNCVRISCIRSENGNKINSSVNGVFVQGRILLVPHHMYWFILKQENQEFMLRNPFRQVSSTFRLKECTVMQLDDKSGQLVDCVMIAMPLRVSSYPSIVNLFANANELDKVVEGDSILAGLREFNSSALTLCNHHIKNAHIALKKNHYLATDGKEICYTTAVAVLYEAATAPGDCGSLLFSRDTNMRGRIISFHIAGNKREGMGLILSKEMVTRNLDKFNKIVIDDRKFVKGSFDCQIANETVHVNPILSSVGLDVPGDYLSVGLSKTLPHPVKTELNPSLIHNMIYETETKPAYLKPIMLDNKLVDPLKKGICKAFTIQPLLDNDILNIAANDVFDQFKHTPEDITRILTYEESIMGVENYDFAHSVNRISSAGFPWVFKKNTSTGKREWLGQGDEWDCSNIELKTAVETLINNAKDNKRSEVVFVSTLKDERRPIAKVEQGKTRVFEAGPMDYTLAVRQYFLGFIESVMRNRISNEVCVGTNVYSNDWNKLGIKLSRYGNHVIAGDFSNFDGSLHQEILWKICDIINQWYNDGDENARVRNVLFEEIVNSVVSVDGILLQKTHAQPSGNPLTVIINSIFNQIVMRMAYLLAKREEDLPLMCDFTDHVSMATYGDDNVLNISPTVIDWYNQVTITKQLSTFGLTYTDEAKSGLCIPYRSLGDVNFLKRKFVKNESGVFTAPLLIDTIRDMCNWVRGKQIRTATQENVQNALMEFALHGKNQYEHEVQLLRETFKKVKLNLRFPLYEEYESFFALQRRQ